MIVMVLLLPLRTLLVDVIRVVMGWEFVEESSTTCTGVSRVLETVPY